MCWTTRFEQHKHQIVAKENIPVIKVLAKKDDSLFAPYYDMEYKLNKVCKAKIHFLNTPSDRTMYIEQGLHCFNKSRIDLDNIFINLDEKCNIHKIKIAYKDWKDTYYPMGIYSIYDVAVVEGYIPAGTEYYENELGNIVTSKLVLTNEIEINKK